MGRSLRSLCLPNRDGLHARPCAALAHLVAGWTGATLHVRYKGVEADAASVFELMSLCAGGGAEVEVEARGPDAEALLEAALRLLEGLRTE